MKITAYEVTCTKGHMASTECGTHISLNPWGNNTPYYEGYDKEITVLLVDGAEVTTHEGRRYISHPNEPTLIELEEALYLQYATLSDNN